MHEDNLVFKNQIKIINLAKKYIYNLRKKKLLLKVVLLLI